MMRRLFSTGIVGACGCISGILIERYRNQGSLSLLADASAAGIVPPTTKLPDIVSSSDKLSSSPLSPQYPSKSLEEKSTRIAMIMKHGYPSFDSVKMFGNFVLSYDRRLRTANWVFEHLTPQSLTYNSSINRRHCDFFEDTTIHPMFRARNDDFKGSGYDRGHLAPAGNYRLSQEESCQTFVLSNISPQVGVGFNRGIWNNLEQYVRYRARRAKNLWSCTGPLYLPKVEGSKKYVKYEVIGNQDVSVPTHFFKVILVENEDGKFDLEAYVMQNKAMDENIPLQAFQVPVESIERAAGFILFDKVSRKSLRAINGTNKYLEGFQKSLTAKKSKEPQLT